MAKLLLVDDDPDALFVFQIVLEAKGHSIATAGNGKQALDAAARFVPDLIVTDWEMPEMDGVTFCQRLRLWPIFAHAPVILLSAQAQPPETTPCWNVFLRKPASLETLETAVDGLLNARLQLSKARMPEPDPAPSRRQPVFWKCWP